MDRLMAEAIDEEATAALSRFASGLDGATLPGGVVDVLERQVLDTLGAMLAASGIGEGCPEIVELVTRQGGTPEATVVGTAVRVPATAAAFANGALAHALDFDDVYEGGMSHVAASTVPAALALAERSAVPVTGRELLAALAAGGEVICRLSLAVAPADGAVPTKLSSQLLGYFGAAATAGRLLKLHDEQMRSAFGLALMQAAGTMEIVHATASVGKCIYEAFSNQGGVQSALLAALGLPAAGASVEGAAGLFRAHFDGHGSRDVLLDGLGTRFLVSDVSFKPWPASKVTHPFVEAALDVAARAEAASERIETITVTVGPWGRAFCEPLAERAHPRTSAAAKNSIPFTVARALARGGLTLRDFTATELDDPHAGALADRIRVRFLPELATPSGTEPGLVELRLASGRTLTARVDTARGHPSRPLDLAAIADKLRECATYARPTPGAAALQACVDLVARLPTAPDVRPLLSMLACDTGKGRARAGRDT
jgi:2-methylcitrate dehydratase PrpD